MTLARAIDYTLGMRKNVLFMVVGLLVMTTPSFGQVLDSKNAKWAGAITGGVVAAGVTIYTAYLQFGSEDEWTDTERIVTYIPMVTSGIISSFLSTLALFDLFIEVPMHPALAGLAGIGAGAIEGALIGGSTFGSFMATATYFDRDFMTGGKSIYEAGLAGAGGGALFGAMIGAIPGAIAGIVLSLLIDLPGNEA